MKSWLKFFGLSFFSDKIAKEARIRGVLNCVLGLIFSLIFIFCGLLAANAIPFYTHYKNAEQFRAFVYDTLEEVELSVNNKLVSADVVVNTFENETDREKYSKNGYNLIIDTRPSKAFDDFEAYCVNKSGDSKIKYEEYLLMSDEGKKNYTFKIDFTPNELKPEEHVEEYEKFLGKSTDKNVQTQYSDLSGKKDVLSEKDYADKLYLLYAKAYYPDFSSFEYSAEVPLLRSYYYRNYINNPKINKSLYIFDNGLFGYFETKSGLNINFYGAYGKLSDGALTAEGADSFIKTAFSSSVGVSANVYLMNIFKFIPIIAVVPVALALVAMLAYRALKDEKYKKYTTCLKIEFSFLFIGSLITAFIQFICGYCVPRKILDALPLIILSAVLAVRTAVLLVGEYVRTKKSAANKAQAERDAQIAEREAFMEKDDRIQQIKKSKTGAEKAEPSDGNPEENK